MKDAIQPLLEVWQPRLGVSLNGFYVQRMKTRCGSCNAEKLTIRLNTELAKKPLERLEDIVVHEMFQLRDPTHYAHFIALMDMFLPKWRFIRQKLNQLPVRHEDWEY